MEDQEIDYIAELTVEEWDRAQELAEHADDDPHCANYFAALVDEVRAACPKDEETQHEIIALAVRLLHAVAEEGLDAALSDIKALCKARYALRQQRELWAAEQPQAFYLPSERGSQQMH